jgi:hypothetical protein
MWSGLPIPWLMTPPSSGRNINQLAWEAVTCAADTAHARPSAAAAPSHTAPTSRLQSPPVQTIFRRGLPRRHVAPQLPKATMTPNIVAGSSPDEVRCSSTSRIMRCRSPSVRISKPPSPRRGAPRATGVTASRRGEMYLAQGPLPRSRPDRVIELMATRLTGEGRGYRARSRPRRIVQSDCSSVGGGWYAAGARGVSACGPSCWGR